MLQKTVPDPNGGDWKKLGRCRLTVGYVEQTAYETKRNADAFETTTLLDDEVHQRDTVPGREDIYKQMASLNSIRQDRQPVKLAWVRRDVIAL